MSTSILSILFLGNIVNGFGWAFLAFAIGTLVAYLLSDQITEMLSTTFSLEECETVEEMMEIEDARAELAENLRRRAQKAREEAKEAEARFVEIDLSDLDLLQVDFFDSLAERPEYWAEWERTEKLTQRLNTLRTASLKKLREIEGIGVKRAARIKEAGEITLEMLREICGPKVTSNALAWGG